MNNDRRKELARIATELESTIDAIGELVSQLETIKDEEQESYDNMPESFQQGDKGERAQAAIDALDSAIGEIDTDSMRGALDYINTASE